jgi:DNA-binding NtrC family response regulator
MPARIVVVHDEPEFVDQLSDALRLAGHEVAAFADPMAALDALDAAQVVDVLITRVQFAPGKPNGISLVRMARVKRPGIRVLFTALPEFEGHAAPFGEFMPLPVRVPDVVEAVTRLLKSEPPDPN